MNSLNLKINILTKTFILISLTVFTLTSCNNLVNKSEDNQTISKMENDFASICSDNCKANKEASLLSCKLTTHELQTRKETLLASLKNQ